MRAAARRWLAAGAVVLAGCGGAGERSGEAGALMSPGEDCSSCHSFTVSGTVFGPSGTGAQGVEVLVGGVTLTSNGAGNFYAAAGVGFPARAETRRGSAASAMAELAPHGACNRCHDGVSRSRLTPH